MEFRLVGIRKRSKGWVVSGLAMHPHYVDKFYNNGDKYVPREIQKDIISIVSSDVRCDHPKNTNADLREKLLKLGWEKEFVVAKQKKIAVDYRKNETGLEVEFRQDTNLIHDMLKLELGFQGRKFSCGILITYDRSVPIVGRHSMNACIQELDRVIDVFAKPNIIHSTIPLWAIGLKPPNN